MKKPIENLREHVRKLMDIRDPLNPDFNGFDVEFNYIEQKTARAQYLGDYTSALLPENKGKNRYSNVLPPQNSRVRLKEAEGEAGSDYVNANFIRGFVPNSERAYIAAQGPLQATFGDFWRMAWELSVAVVVMLTKEVENGRLKCDRYWPEFDTPATYGPFKVSVIDPKDEDPFSEMTKKELSLIYLPSGEERKVTHFQYTAWPDHGLPPNTAAFLDLTEQCNKANTSKGPIIVHCSAGIGRTGTFCTIHSMVEKLKLDKEHIFKDVPPSISIVNTVLYMRDQRPGMIQTKDQYMFCYVVIMEEMDRLWKR